jgi:hypothetical protein
MPKHWINQKFTLDNTNVPFIIFGGISTKKSGIYLYNCVDIHDMVSANALYLFYKSATGGICRDKTTIRISTDKDKRFNLDPKGVGLTYPIPYFVSY